jgi:hypothetical protein
MDTLYSIDETRKLRQREIQNHIKTARISKHIRTSQSYKPGTVERIIEYIQTVPGEFAGRLKSGFAQAAEMYYRKSSTEIKHR